MTITATEEAVRTINILKTIEIASPIEVVFASVLEELGPGSELPDGRPFPMKVEPWPGGRWFRDLGNNAGHLWGHVQVIKPPTLLELCGPMPMSFPAMNHVQYRLKAEGTMTTLTLHHRGMGLLGADHIQEMPKGWGHAVDRIKMVAERKLRGGGR